MYEYEVETLEPATMEVQIAVKAAIGWRLAHAMIHPTETSDEKHKIVVIWERETP